MQLNLCKGCRTEELKVNQNSLCKYCTDTNTDTSEGDDDVTNVHQSKTGEDDDIDKVYTTVNDKGKEKGKDGDAIEERRKDIQTERQAKKEKKVNNR